MRIFDRYLMREILPYFFLGMLVLTVVIFTHEASRFADLYILFSRTSAAQNPILRLILSLLPSIMVFTLPISLLLGVLLGLSRMAGDSEIIAMRASGIGRMRILGSVLALSFVVAALTAYLTFNLLPNAVAAFDNLKLTRADILQQAIASQIKPHIFIENFPGKVVYIQDVDKSKDEWRHIFVASEDSSDASSAARVIAADRGQFYLGATPEESELHLTLGVLDDIYTRKDGVLADNIVEFGKMTVGLAQSTNQPKPSSAIPTEVPPSKLSLLELVKTVPSPEKPQRRAFLIELNKRFALPAACIVFGVLGVGLGITVPRGGRSFGLTLGLGLMLGYYLLFAAGENAANSGALSPWFGIWLANLVALVVGSWLIHRQRYAGTLRINWNWLGSLRDKLRTGGARKRRSARNNKRLAVEKARLSQPRRWRYQWRLVRLLDRLILSDLARFFFLMLCGLTGIFIVFTLFAILTYIVRNHSGAGIVAAYLFFLTPQIVVYMAPLAILISILATFGVLSKSSQVIALLASGNSIYRMAAPVLLVGTFLSLCLFGLQESVLPFANRQQDNLRSQIKGSPELPQTINSISSRWVLGAGPLPRIYHFQHLDPIKNTFSNLVVFEMTADTFALQRRIYANSAHWDGNLKGWVLSNGWIRNIAHAHVEEQTFDSYNLITSDEPSQFKQETPEPSKMSTGELLQHIRDLGRRGFDVLDLRIALYGKFASPFTCLVMALVSLPFAFSVGRRGALYGVGLSIFIGLIFWGTLSLFNTLGHYEVLPPVLAAWGPNLLFGAGGVYLLFAAKT